MAAKTALILVASVALGMPACVRTQLTRYSGNQYAPTSFVEVFRTKLPDRPFIELGELYGNAGALRTESDVLQELIQEARKIGANGIIILEQGRELAGFYNTASATASGYSYGNYYRGSAWGSGTSIPIRRKVIRAIAIRWVKESENPSQ